METLTSSRRPVASFATYAEAQRAVDALSDRAFPVEHLSIVGQDLRFVETITGRRGYGQAAVQGAVSGGLIGAVFGFILGAFSWVDPLISGLALATYGFLLGAVLGAIVGVVGQWASAGRRDFDSVGSVDAGRYEVLCDHDFAAQATAELAKPAPDHR